MIAEQFPEPRRVNYVPATDEPDEDGVLDVGFYKGKLKDGRPYRAECWRMDELVMLTVMFSSIGLERKRRPGLATLLTKEKIVKFRSQVRRLQCHKTFDDVNNPVWAINLPLGENAELQIKLQPYRLVKELEK